MQIFNDKSSDILYKRQLQKVLLNFGTKSQTRLRLHTANNNVATLKSQNEVKHFSKQKHYKPCWMRIISPGWRSWPTRSKFLKRSVVMSCRIRGNEMVTFHAR